MGLETEEQGLLSPDQCLAIERAVNGKEEFPGYRSFEDEHPEAFTPFYRMIFSSMAVDDLRELGRYSVFRKAGDGNLINKGDTNGPLFFPVGATLMSFPKGGGTKGTFPAMNLLPGSSVGQRAFLGGSAISDVQAEDGKWLIELNRIVISRLSPRGQIMLYGYLLRSYSGILKEDNIAIAASGGLVEVLEPDPANANAGAYSEEITRLRDNASILVVITATEAISLPPDRGTFYLVDQGKVEIQIAGHRPVARLIVPVGSAAIILNERVAFGFDRTADAIAQPGSVVTQFSVADRTEGERAIIADILTRSFVGKVGFTHQNAGAR